MARFARSRPAQILKICESQLGIFFTRRESVARRYRCIVKINRSAKFLRIKRNLLERLAEIGVESGQRRRMAINKLFHQQCEMPLLKLVCAVCNTGEFIKREYATKTYKYTLVSKLYKQQYYIK